MRVCCMRGHWVVCAHSKYALVLRLRVCYMSALHLLIGGQRQEHWLKPRCRLAASLPPRVSVLPDHPPLVPLLRRPAGPLPNIVWSGGESGGPTIRSAGRTDWDVVFTKNSWSVPKAYLEEILQTVKCNTTFCLFGSKNILLAKFLTYSLKVAWNGTSLPLIISNHDLYT